MFRSFIWFISGQEVERYDTMKSVIGYMLHSYKTSAQQEKEMVLTESEAECGEKWHASFTKYDPDSSSWKTHQCSLLGDLDEFSETWPQWGLMRDGECWEQRMLEQTIRGTESGLSPNGVDSFHTPNTTGLDGGSNSRRALRKRMEKYPTPQSNDAKNSVVRHRTKSLQVMLGGTIATENPQLIGGHLNPIFVEWLMGWPLGMTDLKPLVMDKSPCVQLPHGES